MAKSQAKEHVQKINMMEENNQYKNVQQYLSPLKLVPVRLLRTKRRGRKPTTAASRRSVRTA